MASKGTREGRKTAIPFGPFLAFGGLVGLFAGPALVDLYVNTSFTRAARISSQDGPPAGR